MASQPPPNPLSNPPAGSDGRQSLNPDQLQHVAAIFSALQSGTLTPAALVNLAPQQLNGPPPVAQPSQFGFSPYGVPPGLTPAPSLSSRFASTNAVSHPSLDLGSTIRALSQTEALPGNSSMYRPLANLPEAALPAAQATQPVQYVPRPEDPSFERTAPKSKSKRRRARPAQSSSAAASTSAGAGPAPRDIGVVTVVCIPRSSHFKKPTDQQVHTLRHLGLAADVELTNAVDEEELTRKVLPMFGPLKEALDARGLPHHVLRRQDGSYAFNPLHPVKCVITKNVSPPYLAGAPRPYKPARSGGAMMTTGGHRLIVCALDAHITVGRAPLAADAACFPDEYTNGQLDDDFHVHIGIQEAYEKGMQIELARELLDRLRSCGHISDEAWEVLEGLTLNHALLSLGAQIGTVTTMTVRSTATAPGVGCAAGDSADGPLHGPPGLIGYLARNQADTHVRSASESAVGSGSAQASGDTRAAHTRSHSAFVLPRPTGELPSLTSEALAQPGANSAPIISSALSSMAPTGAPIIVPPRASNTEVPILAGRRRSRSELDNDDAPSSDLAESGPSQRRRVEAGANRPVSSRAQYDMAAPIGRSPSPVPPGASSSRDEVMPPRTPAHSRALQATGPSASSSESVPISANAGVGGAEHGGEAVDFEPDRWGVESIGEAQQSLQEGFRTYAAQHLGVSGRATPVYVNLDNLEGRTAADQDDVIIHKLVSAIGSVKSQGRSEQGRLLEPVRFVGEGFIDVNGPGRAFTSRALDRAFARFFEPTSGGLLPRRVEALDQVQRFQDLAELGTLVVTAFVQFGIFPSAISRPFFDRAVSGRLPAIRPATSRSSGGLSITPFKVEDIESLAVDVPADAGILLTTDRLHLLQRLAANKDGWAPDGALLQEATRAFGGPNQPFIVDVNTSILPHVLATRLVNEVMELEFGAMAQAFKRGLALLRFDNFLELHSSDIETLFKSGLETFREGVWPFVDFTPAHHGSQPRPSQSIFRTFTPSRTRLQPFTYEEETIIRFLGQYMYERDREGDRDAVGVFVVFVIGAKVALSAWHGIHITLTGSSSTTNTQAFVLEPHTCSCALDISFAPFHSDGFSYNSFKKVMDVALGLDKAFPALVPSEEFGGLEAGMSGPLRGERAATPQEERDLALAVERSRIAENLASSVNDVDQDSVIDDSDDEGFVPMGSASTNQHAASPRCTRSSTRDTHQQIYQMPP